MRLGSDGYLTVCDSELGIYKVNVATGMLSRARYDQSQFLF